MEPYQERVVEEKAQLDDRLSRLRPFLESEIFKTLSSREQYLLQHQETLMNSLSLTLDARIALWSQ
jgi:hypothetical protein